MGRDHLQVLQQWNTNQPSTVNLAEGRGALMASQDSLVLVQQNNLLPARDDVAVSPPRFSNTMKLQKRTQPASSAAPPTVINTLAATQQTFVKGLATESLKQSAEEKGQLEKVLQVLKSQVGPDSQLASDGVQREYAQSAENAEQQPQSCQTVGKSRRNTVTQQ